jgi:hypothetical protein
MHERISRGGRAAIGFQIGVSGPSNLIVASSKPVLDANLPKDLESAVLTAAHQETDPTKLRSFATLLLPGYPAAASVLQARATKLESGRTGTPGVSGAGGSIGVGFKFQPLKALKQIAQDATKVGPVAFIPGAGAAAILATGAVEAGHTGAGKKIGKDLAKNKVLNTLAQTYKSGYMQANPAFFAKTLVLGATDEALHGKNIGQAILDQKKQVTQWLSDKAKYASQVAGVPPEATSGLTAAANLAEGKPLPQDVLGAAGAVIGQAAGPAAQQALQQGAAIGNQLTQAAQGAAGPVLAQIATAKQGLDQASSHAFDTGLALSTAQGLQKKGYAAAHQLLPPAASGGPVGKVLNALGAQTNDLLSSAIRDVKQNLPANAADLAHQAAAALVSQPALAGLSSIDLAKKLGIPEPIARTALAGVSHEVPGAPLVHAHRLEAIVGRPRPPVHGSDKWNRLRQWAAHYGHGHRHGHFFDGGGAQPSGAAYGPYPQGPVGVSDPVPGLQPLGPTIKSADVPSFLLDHPIERALRPPKLDPERYPATPMETPVVTHPAFPAPPPVR